MTFYIDIFHVLSFLIKLFRFKNRELQIMRRLDHCNIVSLLYFFYTSGEKKVSNDFRDTLNASLCLLFRMKSISTLFSSTSQRQFTK